MHIQSCESEGADCLVSFYFRITLLSRILERQRKTSTKLFRICHFTKLGEHLILLFLWQFSATFSNNHSSGVELSEMNTLEVHSDTY